jgi:hypothetical protein
LQFSPTELLQCARPLAFFKKRIEGRESKRWVQHPNSAARLRLGTYAPWCHLVTWNLHIQYEIDAAMFAELHQLVTRPFSFIMADQTYSKQLRLSPTTRTQTQHSFHGLGHAQEKGEESRTQNLASPTANAKVEPRAAVVGDIEGCG